MFFSLTLAHCSTEFVHVCVRILGDIDKCYRFRRFDEARFVLRWRVQTSKFSRTRKPCQHFRQFCIILHCRRRWSSPDHLAVKFYLHTHTHEQVHA